MTSLLDAFALGDLDLKNRIVMPALTRRRCDPIDGVPNVLLLDYYAQRASAGLIITETTAVSRQGNPWSGTACLYNRAHAAGWKQITGTLRASGTKVFVQLVHGGRACDPAFTEEDLLAPSAIPMKEYDRSGVHPIAKSTPKAMTPDDIRNVVLQFRHSATLAAEAGFDGIEIQGGDGYLIDQFLRSGSNRRNDGYGGSAGNRARFCLEVIDAMLEIWPARRIGIKLTPVGRGNDMRDADPVETYSHLLARLNERNIGFVQIPEAENIFVERLFGERKEQIENCANAFRRKFEGAYIANQGLDPDAAAQLLRDGDADLVAFGRLWIANPDLVARIRHGRQLDRRIDDDRTGDGLIHASGGR